MLVISKYELVDKYNREHKNLREFKEIIIDTYRTILPECKVVVKRHKYVVYGYIQKRNAVAIGRALCKDKEMVKLCTDKGRLFRRCEKITLYLSDLKTVYNIIEV